MTQAEFLANYIQAKVAAGMDPGAAAGRADEAWLSNSANGVYCPGGVTWQASGKRCLDAAKVAAKKNALADATRPDVVIDPYAPAPIPWKWIAGGVALAAIIYFASDK